MNSTDELADLKNAPPASPLFYYGWINVVVASAAMVATLPGRTHGLGLVTERLLLDLKIDHVLFARINLIATLVGAAFCIPIGWIIDRFGVRAVLTAVTLALGISVVAMSHSNGAASLLLWLVLVRGFGQSALSVASIAAIGKWFSRRLGMAMGLFAVLLTIGFIGSVLAMGGAVARWDWRASWQGMGFILLGLAPLFWLFARDSPESLGIAPDLPAPDSSTAEQDSAGRAAAEVNFTFRQALATPAFWILVLGSGAFNMVWSGVTLFNESILAERGLSPGIAVQVMAILTGVGLIANLIAGKLATRERVLKLLGVGLILLAGGLVAFPLIEGARGANVYAVAIGLSGGVITVIFFAAWSHLFGRAELGRIQAAAQLATVLASATGPMLMAECVSRTGSYSGMFYALAIVTACIAVAAFVTRTPDISPLKSQ